MVDDEFLNQFGEPSRGVIAVLTSALAIAVKDLKSSNTEMALSQIERLRQRAVQRLTKGGWDISPADGPKEYVREVHTLALVAIHHALDDAREFAIDCDESIYGERREDGFAEFPRDVQPVTFDPP